MFSLSLRKVLTYCQSHLTLRTLKITTCFCSDSYFRAQLWSKSCYLSYIQHNYIKCYTCTFNIPLTVFNIMYTKGHYVLLLSFIVSCQLWCRTCYLPYLQHYDIKFYHQASSTCVTSSTRIIAKCIHSCLIFHTQRLIQNPVKHLRWNVSQK